MGYASSGPTEAFDSYAFELSETDPTSRLIIITPSRLTGMLRPEAGIELPIEDRFALPAPRPGSWQAELLARPLPTKEIFLGSAILKETLDIDPKEARLRVGYLARLASMPSVHIRLVCSENTVMRSGFGALVRGDSHATRFAGPVWTGDGNGILQRDNRPAAPRLCAEAVAYLNQSPDTVESCMTPHLLGWTHAGLSLRRSAYKEFLHRLVGP